MNELLFPILGAVLVVVVVLPACAALSRAALAALATFGRPRLLRFGAPRYLLLVLPSLLPVVWTLSAGFHQAETGRSVIACVVSHEFQDLCIEPLLFVGLLTTMLAAWIWPWLSEYRRATRVLGTRDCEEAARVEALIARHPGLRGLSRRLVVSDGAVGGTATLGLWRPMVAIDAAFIRNCDDETLSGALAHELQHVRDRDPLRYLLLAIALRLNPFGSFLLRREAAAWLFEREVQCDRAAVLAGARPFDIAQALLQASRPSHAAVAHINGGAAKLRLRVELLLAYAEKMPMNDSHRGRSALGLTLLIGVLALVLPHGGATDPLDALHTGVERFATTLLN